MIDWPNGARCACAITFDIDADSLIRNARPDDGRSPPRNHRARQPSPDGWYVAGPCGQIDGGANGADAGGANSVGSGLSASGGVAAGAGEVIGAAVIDGAANARSVARRSVNT